MGLSQNSFTNAYKTKLDGIDTGATKTVVDATLSSTSTNPVQNKAVQAPITRLVDAGAKNLLNLDSPDTINRMTITDAGNDSITASCTNVTWANSGYELSLTAGKTYKFIIYVDSASVSDVQFQCFVDDISGSVKQELGRTPRITSTGMYGIDFVAPTKIRVGINLNNSGTVASGSATYHAMICTLADYKISPEFVPHAKSNYELTQATEPIPRLVDAGTKNLLKIASTSQTINGVTFNPDPNVGKVNSSGSITDASSATFTCFETTLPAGRYHYSCIGAAQRNKVDSFVQDVSGDTPTLLARDYEQQEFALAKSTPIRVRLRVYTGYESSEFYPMLCTAEDYAISPEFVPYAPSNRELYNSIHGSFKSITPLSGITLTNDASTIISDVAIFNFNITSSSKISAGSATPVIQLDLGILSSTLSRPLLCSTSDALIIAWFNGADGRIYIKPTVEIAASTTIRISGIIVL